MSRNEAVIRETKRATLSLMHNVSAKADEMKIRGLLKNYDASAVEQPRLGKVRTVTFIITRMVRFHGGQTSILHLGTELEKLGVKVCYLSYKPQSVEEMQICAASNLEGFRGRLFPFDRYMAAIKRGKIKEPDVVVASSWDTVSFAKKFRESYKMYFVQDYEPLFYKFGEEYLLCRNTYLQGLHMVSLGSWNKMMIERECGQLSAGYGAEADGQGADAGKETGDSMTIDTVDFPYDSTGYSRKTRDFEAYANKKTVTLAVYLKYYGKRLPNLLPYMLQNTADKLKKQGIELKVQYFGEAKTFKAPGGTNLGQLNKSELNELYSKADFGMVASMSNISLVPYEMHAAGLPVIEFSDGTYPFFFRGETALLTKIGERDIADLLLKAMKTPEILERMDAAAAEQMKNLSWENTGRQFFEIINKVIEK